MNTRNYFVVDSTGFIIRADGKNGRRLGGLSTMHSPFPVPRAAFSTRAYAETAAREYGLARGERWIVSTVGEI